MKRIVFFDGDGTLWYPKTTKHRVAPHWIYYDEKTSKNPFRELVMIPGVLPVLKKLKKKGIVLVLLSTHPRWLEDSDKTIRQKVERFNLQSLFDEVHATGEFHESKGEFMIGILKKRNIPRNQAMMVGDKYAWDYLPARKNGIEALLIQTPYEKESNTKKAVKKIRKLKELLQYID